MIYVKLVGMPACRRYQKMHSSIIQAAKELGIALHIEEVGDIESLAQFNPLSLPRLYVQEE